MIKEEEAMTLKRILRTQQDFKRKEESTVRLCSTKAWDSTKNSSKKISF